MDSPSDPLLPHDAKSTAATESTDDTESMQGKTPKEHLLRALTKVLALNRFWSESLSTHARPSTAFAAKIFKAGTTFTDRIEASGLAEGRASWIEQSLPRALERERRMELRWHKLAMRELWRSGSWWSPLLPEQKVPPLRPQKDWHGQLPWPGGVSVNQGFFHVCAGFCKFVYRLPEANKMAKRCLVFTSILGVLPVIFSTLFSLTVLHVQHTRLLALGKELDSPALFPWKGHERLQLVGLCIAMAVTAFAKMLVYYQYQIDVPLAGIRFHFRHVLQRHILELHSYAHVSGLRRHHHAQKHGATRLSPGACAQLLDPLVFQAVNFVWGFLFEIPETISHMLAVFVAGVLTQEFYGATIVSMYVGCTIVSWLSVFLVFLYYRNSQAELAHLKIMWNVRYGALAAAQIIDMTNEGSHKPITATELNEKAGVYGAAAFVYRKRAFQDFFMNLVFENNVAVVQFIFYGSSFLVIALLAMDPDSNMPSSVLAAGASLLTSSMSASTALAGKLSSLVYGHAAVVQLADIFNEFHYSQEDGSDSTASTCKQRA
eukprot:TRINITY_DN7929_c0_g1_i1.p1 TRINITY_DN7929_c0_g1~~TRINITY_DN7929_c0_g1_i1.p1  ORF type:complete len:546 (-),score=79.80 TRINITY_DN7929_c0_g1_i1:102-1739(-)